MIISIPVLNILFVGYHGDCSTNQSGSFSKTSRPDCGHVPVWKRLWTSSKPHCQVIFRVAEFQVVQAAGSPLAKLILSGALTKVALTVLQLTLVEEQEVSRNRCPEGRVTRDPDHQAHVGGNHQMKSVKRCITGTLTLLSSGCILSLKN